MLCHRDYSSVRTPTFNKRRMTEEVSPDSSLPNFAIADVLEGKKLEEGICLCLSGGGFRAMIFHLGSLIPLNDVCLLPTIDRVSSVSGGLDRRHTRLGLV